MGKTRVQYPDTLLYSMVDSCLGLQLRREAHVQVSRCSYKHCKLWQQDLLASVMHAVD